MPRLTIVCWRGPRFPPPGNSANGSSQRQSVSLQSPAANSIDADKRLLGEDNGNVERARKGKRGPRVAQLLIVCVCLIAVWETAAHFVLNGRAPSSQEWQGIKPRVSALFNRGDLVIAAPAWGEPLARQALGDALMPLPVVARADDDEFPRAIQIGILGQERREFSDWPELHRETFGKFELSVRKNPTFEPIRYQLLEHVDSTSMTVSQLRNGHDEACPFNDSAAMSAGNLGGDPTAPKMRFVCSGGPLHWVGVTIIDDEKYRPRRCMWAPPLAAGPLVLRFYQVPFGRHLVGHAGAPWLMVRDGVGPPITLTASTSRGTLGSVAAKDTDGWVRFEWNTESLENTTADLQLSIVGAQGGDQRFCFTLESR